MKIANREGFKFGERAYLIGHEFGLICVSYGNTLQEAIDNAVDDGLMDCVLMSDEDHAEYEDNGWDDSYMLAGNASEPFWTEYLWIKPADERKAA